ncbi:MAG: DUF502 domain-containing protein [Candidatus Omnitrophota bacterium]|jgi:uncharacterized membrane protein
MRNLRKYFFTGLLVALPTFITVYLLYVIFQFIDGIWGKLINFYLKKHLGFAIPGLGFILGVLTILAIGFVATNFFGKKLLHLLERWFLKFPFIRQIYMPAKQIIDSFFSKDKPSFKKVVMVEYPSKGIWSIGFITNDGFKEAQEKAGEELVHVFIATTPSPFTGFLILVPKKDVKILDMPVEQGIKLIVSGGILKP